MNYDRSNPLSIYEFSLKILDKSLSDYLYLSKDDSNIETLSEKLVENIDGKGSFGQIIEKYFFEYALNNDKKADFSEAGVELKCTPLKLSAQKEFLIKERLVCTMIDYRSVYKESFEESEFLQKCRLLLIMFYLHEADKLSYELIVKYIALWQIPEKDLLIIKQDFNTIVNKIKRGEAHLLSEGDTVYLGACRKGHKNDNLVEQPFSEEKAKKRAFSLKPAYMRTILNKIQDSGTNHISNLSFQDSFSFQLVDKESLKTRNFEDIIIERFDNYKGKNIIEISKELHIITPTAKQRFYIIANAIASGLTSNTSIKIEQSEEFKKSGIILKTIRVQKSGHIKESMSFENIDYDEVENCEYWCDSRLYEIFTGKFMFVIFKENNNSDYLLDRVLFWTMPQKDLDIAQEFWKDIKTKLINKIEIKSGAFWKLQDHRCFHIRPKARNKADILTRENGELAPKLCYWFNKEYVETII